jgi:mannosyltransferase
MSTVEHIGQNRGNALASASLWANSLAVRAADWMKDHAKACVCAATVLCLGLRMAYLGDKSLWIDEIWSLRIAQLPWHSFGWELQNQDPNSSLYYSLLHLWLNIGRSEACLRSLSVFFAAVTIPVVYAVGKRMMGTLEGLAAASLMVINLFHIQWSQEARGYSLLVLGVTLATLLFVRSIESPTLANWSIYCAVSVLSIYVHLFAGLVLAAHWASLIFLRPKDIPWRRWIQSNFAIFIFALPLLCLTYVRSAAPFVPLDWLPRPTLHDVYDAFYQLAGNANYPESHGGKSLVCFYLILCILALVSIYESARLVGRSPELWSTGLLFCWLTVPAGLIFGVSLLQPTYVSRYLLVSVPALVLLGAKGLARMRPRWFMAAVVIFAMLSVTAGLSRYYQYRERFQEWRAVARLVIGRVQPGDGMIFCVAPGRLLFDYYADPWRGSGASIPVAVYPDLPDFNNNPHALDYLPAWSDSQLKMSVSNHPRIWLIVYHDFFGTTERARDRFKATLGGMFTNVNAERINGVSIDLYSEPRQENQLPH